MKRIFVTMHTGYCGEDAHEALEVEDDMSEDEMQELAYDMAVDNASMYGRDMCDCEDEDCEYEHDGDTNIEGFAVPYVAELHDMHSHGGKGFD